MYPGRPSLAPLRPHRPRCRHRTSSARSSRRCRDRRRRKQLRRPSPRRSVVLPTPTMRSLDAGARVRRRQPRLRRVPKSGRPRRQSRAGLAAQACARRARSRRVRLTPHIRPLPPVSKLSLSGERRPASRPSPMPRAPRDRHRHRDRRRPRPDHEAPVNLRPKAPSCRSRPGSTLCPSAALRVPVRVPVRERRQRRPRRMARAVPVPQGPRRPDDLEHPKRCA